jgi:AIR synthase-related protein
MTELQLLGKFLTEHPAVREKALIHHAFDPALEISGGTKLGDDCAAIRNPAGSGHLLFAAEGMLESFVEDDPWFAGYSAVMVNLSDVAAMGGRPIAITDVIWTPDEEISAKLWAGMRAASEAYGVPIVGGHTTHIRSGKAALAAAVLGHAGEHLLTSFDAKPGDHLVIAIDMTGAYRGDKPFWNASTTSTPERLREDLALMAELAEKNLCAAGKDISNGGIVGTLAMLCQCSRVGALIDLAKTPRPENTAWERWLVSFPSYGYLLAVSPERLEAVKRHFAGSMITCCEIGNFSEALGISLGDRGERVELVF